MKKILAFLMMLVMVATLTVAAQADDNAFVISPSLNPAPTLVSFENLSEDCDAELIITAYANRHMLPEDVRAKIESAYALIAGTTDLGTLCGGLAAYAKKLNVSTSDFAVSDLFDVSMTDCYSHDLHGAFDIVLAPESLKNFVCLLHYYDGRWNIVTQAEVTNNGTHLEFTEDEFSPFAIVVNTNTNTNPGKPGDTSNTAVYAIIMMGSALAVIVLARKLRKQSV